MIELADLARSALESSPDTVVWIVDATGARRAAFGESARWFAGRGSAATESAELDAALRSLAAPLAASALSGASIAPRPLRSLGDRLGVEVSAWRLALPGLVALQFRRLATRDHAEIERGGHARARALDALAGTLVDAVAELTRDGHIVSTTALPKSWAGSDEDLEGRPLREFLHPEDVERGERVLLEPRGDLEPQILRWRGASRGWRSVETRGITYTSESGALRSIAIGRDVTDELAALGPLAAVETQVGDDALRDANLTALAGGVAHDFNNLLTVSLGITDLIADQLPDDSPVRAQISQVISASRQAADLARQLLSVTGAGSRPHAPCDLNALIGGIEGLLRSALPPSVALDWRPCADAPWTEADQTQLRQVVLNLVKNAGEAIGPRSGRIAVATQRAQDAAGQRVAVVEVSDTGPGMDATTRARIFDPTFTTKLTGHGLGLAVVRSVVARHHGRISVESEPAAGTTFRIELPLLSDAAAAAEQQLKELIARAPERDGGTVLIIDDNAAVRVTSAALLGAAGFSAIEAEDGAAAREVVNSGTAIDCAVVDLLMPDVDGLDLIDELRRLRPGLKIVVCSGAHDRLPTERSDLVVLEKPFRYAQLIAAVSRCLGAAS